MAPLTSEERIHSCGFCVFTPRKHDLCPGKITHNKGETWVCACHAKGHDVDKSRSTKEIDAEEKRLSEASSDEFAVYDWESGWHCLSCNRSVSDVYIHMSSRHPDVAHLFEKWKPDTE